MSPTLGILSQTTPNGLKEISWNSRLVLGTAAFQSGYGIINSGKSPERNQWWNLLEASLAQDIKKIDTAVAYGEAERILGDFGMKNFSVITKIRCEESRAGGDLEDKLVQSLRRLKIPRCYGLLLHNDEALAGASGGEIAGALHGLIRKGLVEKIGISSYEAAQAEVLAQRYGLQILQIPCNPLDRRVVESGTLRRWTERGIEVHLRSVFLQGLLLRELPVSAHVSPAIPLAQARGFREKCQAAGVSPLHACLSFVYGTSPTAHIVIGPTSVAELRQIVNDRPDGFLLQPDGLPAWSPSFDPRSWESPVAR